MAISKAFQSFLLSRMKQPCRAHGGLIHSRKEKIARSYYSYTIERLRYMIVLLLEKNSYIYCYFLVVKITKFKNETALPSPRGTCKYKSYVTNLRNTIISNFLLLFICTLTIYKLNYVKPKSKRINS